MPGSYTYSYKATANVGGFDASTLDTITVDVSAVPLPASASLFGAALTALGAAGYGLKRKKAAAAA